MVPDLSDKAIAAALFGLLDEIEDTVAKATSPQGSISARLLGRVLAFRLGLPMFEAQRVAKAWQATRRGGRPPWGAGRVR
jgi:hypothetical protein